MKSYGVVRFSVSVFLRILFSYILCLLFSVTFLTINTGLLMRIISQVLNLSLFFSIVFGVSFNIGENDHNIVKHDNIPEAKFKGLIAGLLATIPFAIISTLLLLFKADLLQGDFLYFYRVLSAPFFPLNITLLPATMTISEISWGAVIFSASTVLIYPFIPAISYIFGYKGISLKEILIYKK